MAPMDFASRQLYLGSYAKSQTQQASYLEKVLLLKVLVPGERC